MKIMNARFGFATNSSSTHSVIVLPEGTPMPATDEWESFGWQYFTAADEESKRKYAMLTIQSTIRRVLSKSGLFNWQDKGDMSSYLMNAWFDAGIDLENYDRYTNMEGSIDHQSLTGLPMRWDGKMIDIPFAKAFMDAMVNSNVIILGGNDNDDRTHPLSYSGEAWDLIEKANLPLDGLSSNVVRFDAEYNYWTSFNRSNGAKLRFRISGDEPIEKSSYPELVDIKITDMCPYACAFCYMGSTSSGLHAKAETVNAFIRELSSKNVFEIAIGGGEPTMHPYFVSILKYARLNNIVPNFTTKNLSWLRDPTQWVDIIRECGAFAYSADSKKDVVNLVSLLDTNGISRSKATIQIIPEVLSTWALDGILREAGSYGMTVTLLGYKTTGRGAEYAENKLDTDWLSVVTEIQEEGSKLPRIGVDTILAASTDLSDFDPKLYTLEEGKFSMYIDAVGVKAGPSSFANEDEFVSLGEKPRYAGYPKPGYVTELKLPHNDWNDSLWEAFRSY